MLVFLWTCILGMAASGESLMPAKSSNYSLPQQPNLFLSLLYPAAALSHNSWEYMLAYSTLPSKWVKFGAEAKKQRNGKIRTQMINLAFQRMHLSPECSSIPQRCYRARHE